MKRKVPESLKFKDYLIAAVEMGGLVPYAPNMPISDSWLCANFF